MIIDFDPNKDRLNIRNHGTSLQDAEKLEWDWLVAEEDQRYAYGERRMVGFAPIGRTVFCVVFTEEDDAYRIISLRRATNKEVREYASKI